MKYTNEKRALTRIWVDGIRSGMYFLHTGVF